MLTDIVTSIIISVLAVAVVGCFGKSIFFMINYFSIHYCSERQSQMSLNNFYLKKEKSNFHISSHKVAKVTSLL